MSTVSIPHIDYIYALAKELNVTLHCRRFIPVGTGARNRHLILPPQDHIAILRKLLNFQKHNEVDIEIEDPIVAKLTKSRPQIGCGAGTTQLGVSTNGDIFPCIFFREPIGNILQDNMTKLWEDSKLLKSIRNRDTINCRKCIIADSCGGCRACAPTPFSDDPMCCKPLKKSAV